MTTTRTQIQTKRYCILKIRKISWYDEENEDDDEVFNKNFTKIKMKKNLLDFVSVSYFFFFLLFVFIYILFS